METNLYRFEDYCLDARRAELRRGDVQVHLEPQVFDVLLYLVRHRDRVVSKEELLTAVWAGRVVSESTLSSRLTAVRHAVGDSGKRQRFIRTVHRKGFRFVGTVHEDDTESDQETGRAEAINEIGFENSNFAAAPRAFHNSPSIAILRFANLSTDSALTRLIDGVVEDAAAALSHYPSLLVVAPSAGSANQGRSADPRQVGRELGVRYVIEGSLRKAAQRVRVMAKLIDAATGVLLSANSFDLDLGQQLDLQDRVTARVVGSIGPRLEQAEVERAKRGPIEYPGAYQLYVQGLSNAYQWTQAGMDEALRLFHRAIEIDPEFAPAYGMAAYCYVQRNSYGWFTDRSQETAACNRVARRAAELANEDAVTLARTAHALAAVVGDFDGGAVLAEQACRLNPNLWLAWYSRGWIRIFLGQPKIAIEHLETALQLSPSGPFAFKVHAANAYAHFFNEHYDQACLSAEHAMRTRTNYLTAMRGAAASHAFAGRLIKARQLMAQVRESNSALRLSQIKDLIPLNRARDFERWIEGLYKSGLPE